MAYIWEKYSADKEYATGKKICPYLEVYNDSPQRAEVNPLLRFSGIFEWLHNEALKETINNQEELENVVFHYLAQLDRCKGMNCLQVIIERTRNEICNGYFGAEAEQLWKNLNYNDREIVLYELAQRLLADNHTFFMDAMNKLFPLSSLCYEKDTKIYYLYIGVKNTDYNQTKFKLLKVLFWNVNYILKPIWEKHYGIIGIRDTMHVGRIQIV